MEFKSSWPKHNRGRSTGQWEEEKEVVLPELFMSLVKSCRSSTTNKMARGRNVEVGTNGLRGGNE